MGRGEPPVPTVQSSTGDGVSGAGDAAPLVTFGHGTAPREQLAALLRDAGVLAVVDVRRAPGSRRNPEMARAALEQWMPDEGITYRWESRLGGFRTARADSPDTYWENPSFRGYAGYTREPAFLAAMDVLLRQAADARTAVMCAETLWWRCHRRLIADFAVLARRTPVLHLGHDGQLTVHQPAAGARLRDDVLVYDQH